MNRRWMLFILNFALVQLLTQPVAAQIEEVYGVISDASGVVGDVVTVELTVSFEEADVQGWQWSICHEEGLVDLADSFSPGEAISDLGFSYLALIPYPEGFACGALLQVFPASVLEPGQDLEILQLHYELLDEGSTDLEWCGNLGSPVVENQLLSADANIEFDGTTDGHLQIYEGFKRGDVNSNGDVETLVDVLYLLDWGFEDGDAPPCMSAADVDDDGSNLPLLDAIFALTWAFLDGDEPPAPGPDECGGDGTDDDLNCNDPEDGC